MAPGSSSTSTRRTRSASASTASVVSSSRTFLRALSGSPRPTRRSSSCSVTTNSCATPSRRTRRPRSDEALLDLYRKLRPGELTTVESARSLIKTLFRTPKRYDLTRVGRYKVNQKLGGDATVTDMLDNYRADEQGLITDEDIVNTILYLMNAPRRQGGLPGRRHRQLPEPPDPDRRRVDPEPDPRRADPPRACRA